MTQGYLCGLVGQSFQSLVVELHRNLLSIMLLTPFLKPCSLPDKSALSQAAQPLGNATSVPLPWLCRLRPPGPAGRECARDSPRHCLGLSRERAPPGRADQGQGALHSVGQGSSWGREGSQPFISKAIEAEKNPATSLTLIIMVHAAKNREAHTHSIYLGCKTIKLQISPCGYL